MTFTNILDGIKILFYYFGLSIKDSTLNLTLIRILEWVFYFNPIHSKQKLRASFTPKSQHFL